MSGPPATLRMIGWLTAVVVDQSAREWLRHQEDRPLWWWLVDLGLWCLWIFVVRRFVYAWDAAVKV